MSFTDGFSGAEGVALAIKTIELMRQHAIPTNPSNYEIWITHASGTRAELSQAIETRIATGEAFSAAVNEDLFERFFANTRLSVQMLEASECIARELSDVAATLRDAGQQAGAYSNALDTAALGFEGGVDPARFSEVVARLGAATREMAGRNRQLSEQMATSSRQVETLQATLQSVKVEAHTDSLTGLANRKLFDESLRRRVSESDATGRVCLIMCDIDHFKRFNDTWGHLVGDQVLRFIAQMLRQHAGADALAARYGGEEFAIIMPRAPLEAARALASAINQAVKAKPLMRRSTKESIGAITLSIGIAQHRDGDTATDLISRADACLYAAKRGGRDRVTTELELHRASAA